MSVATMRNTLSNKEFYGWLAYFEEPTPDIPEIQMATMSLLVAQGLGSKDAKHTDFLIRKPELKIGSNKPFLAEDTTSKESQRPANGTMSQNEVMSIFAGMATPLEG